MVNVNKKIKEEENNKEDKVKEVYIKK